MYSATTDLRTCFLHPYTIARDKELQHLMGKECIAALLPFCKHREELTVNDSGADVPMSVLVSQP